MPATCFRPPSCPSPLRLAALLAILGGCAAGPDYEIHVFEPHRDVLAVMVRLPERLEASEYRQLASRELPSMISAREASCVPLYEVCIEFIIRHDPSGDEELAARLTLRDETGAEPSEHSVSHAPLEIH